MPIRMVKPAAATAEAPPKRRAVLHTPAFVGNPWTTEGCKRPLAYGQQTHNGARREGLSGPDERFRPLLIALDKDDRSRVPIYAQERADTIKKLTPESVAKLAGYQAASLLILELIAADCMGKSVVSPEIKAVLLQRVAAEMDTHVSVRVNDVQKSILSADLTEANYMAASGPWYCETLLALECHFPTLLRG